MRIDPRAFLKTLRFAFVVSACAGGRASLGADGWPQWGGPSRDFAVPSAAPLNWPEGGFKELWRRPLGLGFSGIVGDGSRLYTMLRRGDQEVVVALSAADGKTLWEHAYDAPWYDWAIKDYGGGPNSTPLLAKGRLVTVGSNALVKCLDAQTGKVLWSVDLLKDLHGTKLQFGYNSSPLIYRDTVILPVGGEKSAIVALRLTDGSKVWAAQDFTNTYSTPLIIDVDGQDQLVIVMSKQVIGLDPTQGELLWEFPMRDTREWDTHVIVPVWGKDRILFVGSFEQATGLRLKRTGGKSTVEELWSNDKIQIDHSNVVRVGDVLYTSTEGSPKFILALDAKTGEKLWKERGFGLAYYLALGDQLLFVDEKGQLALARPDRTALHLLGSYKLFNIAETIPPEEMSDALRDGPPLPAPDDGKRVWTAPALMGDILLARDQKEIVAVKLH